MPLSADFTWKMVPRAGDWVYAWNSDKLSYDPNYVHPSAFDVELGSTRSGAGIQLADFSEERDRIVSSQWEVTGVDHAFHQVLQKDEQLVGKAGHLVSNTGGTRIGAGRMGGGEEKLKVVPPGPVRVLLPGLGRYRVLHTVKSSHSESASTEKEIKLGKTLLVASLGDSMAAGEGNPDINAPEGASDYAHDWDRNATWADRRCHRSIFSGHARSAVWLEESDFHRTVTFLPFACSGASISEGLVGPYAGEEGPKYPKLPGQIKALRGAIGSDGYIDILLITAGVNDLGFANVIETFAEDVGGDEKAAVRQDVERKLGEMDSLYDSLALTLSRYLAGKVGRVYITEYPVDIFHDDHNQRHGCGTMINVSTDDAEFIFEKGNILNEKIREAAQRHGWQVVTGLTKAFHGHGLCCKDMWYISVSKSFAEQNNLDGTCHPNPSGHIAIGQKIVSTVRATKPAQSRPKVVTVDFEKVLITDRRPPNPPVHLADLPPVFEPLTFALNNRTVKTEPLRVGKEVELPPGKFRLKCEVGNGLVGIVDIIANASLPALEEGIPVNKAKNSVPGKTIRQPPHVTERFLVAIAKFGEAQGYGAGQHQAVGTIETGSLEVNFKVSVEDQLPTFQPIKMWESPVQKVKAQ